jgi:putative YphP/YqiW family bacilliredoxin
MRAELTALGVEELRTAADVDAALVNAQGTMLVVINSVCGCSAANARPAVRLAMQVPIQPDRYVTVFAGQDLDATVRLRGYLHGIPPSSPFIALMKDGDPVFVLERRHIEGRSASAIAIDLANAYSRYCGSDGEPEETAVERPEVNAGLRQRDEMPSTFRSIL